MFTDQDFGKLITKSASELLLKYTGNNDRAEAAEETGLSASIIYQVCRRVSNLTESNSEAIEILLNRAKSNCEKQGAESKSDLSKFNQLTTV